MDVDQGFLLRYDGFQVVVLSFMYYAKMMQSVNNIDS